MSQRSPRPPRTWATQRPRTLLADRLAEAAGKLAKQDDEAAAEAAARARLRNPRSFLPKAVHKAG
jgi:hypothetical protein